MLALLLALLTSGLLPLHAGGGAPGVVASPADTGGGIPNVATAMDTGGGAPNAAAAMDTGGGAPNFDLKPYT